MKWADVIADPTLKDLPFKIELNQWGLIEMSPASNWHGRRQTWVIQYLTRELSSGEIITEPVVQTALGVRVPDVGWGSESFTKSQGDLSPFTIAPELCVEVLSDSNTDAEMAAKRAAYFAAGAKEVWLVSDTAEVAVYTPNGLQAQSDLVGKVPKISV